MNQLPHKLLPGVHRVCQSGKKMGVGYEWLNNIADVHPGKQMTKHA